MGCSPMRAEEKSETRYELLCLSVLLGECFGIVYVIGDTVLRVLNLW